MGALRLGGSFADVEIDTLSFDFPLQSANQLITALAEATERTGALVRTADDLQRRRIREGLEARLAPWLRGEHYAVPAPVKAASG